MLCVMEMELDRVLNWINYKLFLEVMKIDGFRNANNQFWNQTKGCIRNKTKIEIQGSFWNQKLNNNNENHHSWKWPILVFGLI